MTWVALYSLCSRLYPEPFIFSVGSSFAFCPLPDEFSPCSQTPWRSFVHKKPKWTWTESLHSEHCCIQMSYCSALRCSGQQPQPQQQQRRRRQQLCAGWRPPAILHKMATRGPRVIDCGLMFHDVWSDTLVVFCHSPPLTMNLEGSDLVSRTFFFFFSSLHGAPAYESDCVYQCLSSELYGGHA